MCSTTHANYHTNRLRHARNVGKSSQAEEEVREEGNKETEGEKKGVELRKIELYQPIIRLATAGCNLTH